jgi:hypothetical protein
VTIRTILSGRSPPDAGVAAPGEGLEAAEAWEGEHPTANTATAASVEAAVADAMATMRSRRRADTGPSVSGAMALRHRPGAQSPSALAPSSEMLMSANARAYASCSA